ncbi:MAG: A/G-specific adenine glycosylase [Treponema sp.]|nr:A/G-specific adenine glycosylase [Treponema sp.]
MDIKEFRKVIYSYYEESGRHFPWREKPSGWGVLVSEFMLQQTQTDRVIPYWLRWMKLWPKPSLLAASPMETVQREWSGLGYNRRSRFLRQCAKFITEDHQGKVPETPEILKTLPGIGNYTAGAVAAFAYNYPSVFIETNIRSVVLHFFFPDKEGVEDKEIFPVLEEALDRDNARKWYYALMDYGAALKKVTANPGRRSAAYARQSRFEGSFRQLRGRVVKCLAFKGPATGEEIARRTGIDEEELYKVIDSLEKEMMVAEKEGRYCIP